MFLNLEIFSDVYFILGIGMIILMLILITMDIIIIPTMIMSIVSLTSWFIYLVFVFNRSQEVAIVLAISFFVVMIIYLFIVFKFKLWRIVSNNKNLPSASLTSFNLPLEEINQKEVFASTDLRPTGKIKIGNKFYDGLSIQGFIKKGSYLLVIDQFGGQYKVRKKKIN